MLNRIKEAVGMSFVDLDPIYKNFWISSKPSVVGLDDYMEELKENFIRNIVVLLSDQEIKEKLRGLDLIGVYKKAGFHVSRYPIQDFSVPKDMEGFRKFVKRISGTLSQTVIHCSAGLGRSGLFMSCLLTEFDFLPHEAIEHVRKNRPGAVETPDQEDFVFDYDMQAY